MRGKSALLSWQHGQKTEISSLETVYMLASSKQTAEDGSNKTVGVDKAVYTLSQDVILTGYGVQSKSALVRDKL